MTRLEGNHAAPLGRLLLVMPPQPGLLEGFSSALFALDAWVRASCPGVDVLCLDLSHVPPRELRGELRRALGTGRPLAGRTFVGITTTTASYQSALRTARAVRALAPGSVIILGGHHAAPEAETVLRRHRGTVDLVCLGEGERTLGELVRRWPDREAIPGVAYLEGDETRRTPAPVPLSVDELDQLPALIPEEAIGPAGKFGHVTYVSARGCPLQCSFCAVSNQTIRAKSISAVVRDIRELVGRGFTRIAIEDNFFAHSPRRTRELCAALAELRASGLDFSWDCQTRVESMADAGTLAAMAGAGCEAVYLGVEALLAEHLRYLGKTAAPERYLRLLKDSVVPALLRSPIDTYLNLQLGLPGETREQHVATLDRLAGLGAQAAAAGRAITLFPQLHVVYPGTRHFAQGSSEGRFPASVFESFTAWEAEQEPVLRWLGEHFAHGTGGLPEGILEPGPLREGGFVVDAEAVLQISSVLTEMSRLPGIQVFRYGEHLVPLRRSSPEGAAVPLSNLRRLADRGGRP